MVGRERAAQDTLATHLRHRCGYTVRIIVRSIKLILWLYALAAPTLYASVNHICLGPCPHIFTCKASLLASEHSPLVCLNKFVGND